MKLRFLLVSALALAFMVPAALASSTEEAPVGDDAPSSVDETQKDGVTDETDKASYDKKAKKHKKAKRDKKHSMRDLCRPRVGLKVRGDLVSVDAVAGTFVVLVDKANHHGKRLVGSEVTFMLAKKAKVRKHGKATLADVQAALEAAPGYRVKVMGRACKSELKDEKETPDLYAKHVKVKAPVMDEESKTDGDGEEKTDSTDEEPKSDSTVDAA